MRKILTLFFSLFCISVVHAQHPDSAGLSAARTALQEHYDHIRLKYAEARKNIDAFKQACGDQVRDSISGENISALRQERWKWKMEYELWRKESSAFKKQQKRFIRAMEQYHRSQPYFRYKRKSQYQMAAGIFLVSAGGAAAISGIMTGLMEHMVPISAEEQRKENIIMVTCFASGVVLALSSIPFFRAATKNRARYKQQLVWNLKIIPVSLPGGGFKEVIGLSLRVPLFQKTGQRH